MPIGKVTVYNPRYGFGVIHKILANSIFWDDDITGKRHRHRKLDMYVLDDLNDQMRDYVIYSANECGWALPSELKNLPTRSTSQQQLVCNL